MAGEIISDRQQIQSAAYDIYESAYGLAAGSPVPRGGSRGAAFDRMVELSQRLHPLMGTMQAAIQAEADAVTDAARTLEETDRNAAGAIGGA